MNSDCHIVLAAPQESMKDYFYKNTDADEMIFVHEGSGIVHTQYGELPFSYGDYIVLPRGTIYQISFDTPDNRLFIVESFYAAALSQAVYEQVWSINGTLTLL